MAKKSHIARNEDRIKAVQLDETKRATLRAAIAKEDDYDKREAMVNRLNKMRRDGSRVRIRKRCATCGRPRGVYGKFGLCRCCLRLAVLMGLVPGIRKASW